MSLVTDAHQLELALSALTATLPDLPADQLVAHRATAAAIAAATAGATAALAGSLAGALAGYLDRRVPLEGWGLVASSAHTLARAIAKPDGGHAGAALIAARFELDSLLPAAGATAAPPPVLTAPHVPSTSLRRRS